MKIQELKGLSKEELIEKEKSLKEELFKLNIQRYTSSPEKPHRFAAVRKEIARIETILKAQDKRV
jgi:large subunit ribosomal protein L29